MNFKKLKRLLSVMLSASMILSSNLTVLAAETAEPQQVESVAEQESHEHDWQLETVMKDATADEAGWGTYVCECGETQTGVINPVASAVEDDDNASGGNTEQTEQKKPVTVGETEYDTLASALEDYETAAPTEAVTVTLNDNVSLDGTHDYQLDNVTIQTSGYTIAIAGDAKIKFHGGTFINSEKAQKTETGWATHTILNAEEGSELTITGSVYKTAGVKALIAQGSVTATDASFECTLTDEEMENVPDNYDGASMIQVTGKGMLKMASGAVKANKGFEENGMYGIFVSEGGKIELGDKDAHTGPEITSRFAAVGLNGQHPDAGITIHGGTYKSTVQCTGDGLEKHNAVLYLSANCSLAITGGTFISADGSKAHIISAPNGTDIQTPIRNMAISGGNFQSKGDVFFGEGITKKTIDITGGKFSKDISAYLYGEYTLLGNETDGYSVGKVNQSTVAIVGNDGYDTLDAALNAAIETGTAAQKATVTLKANVTLSGEASYDLSHVNIETMGYSITVKDGARVVLSNATINNNQTGSKANKSWHSIIVTEKGSFLKIAGGVYTTKASKILRTSGNVIIDGEAEFRCTATAQDVPNPGEEYDGQQLFQVSGGQFEMLNGTISTDTILNQAGDSGMYGISVQNGATVILGKEGVEGGPVIHSAFAAIGLNNLSPSAAIKIYGGEYTSKADGSETDGRHWYSVLYLSATSNVLIAGGNFKAFSKSGQNVYVVSVPYGKTGSTAADVKLNITGGTFEIENAATGKAETTNPDVFYFHADADKKVVRGGSFSSDPSAYVADTTVYTVTPPTESKNLWNVESAAEGCSHKIGNASALAYVNYQAPSCENEGVAAHYECSICLKKFGTATAGVPLTDEQVKLDRKNHEGNFFEKKAATCTEPARKSYFQCTNCKKFYLTELDMKENKSVEKNATYEDGSTALGHDTTYVAGNNTKNPYQFVWPEVAAFASKAEKDNFDTATENGIDVKVVCNRCEEDVTGEANLTATVTGGTLPENYTCGQENAKVTYEATITIPAPSTPENREETGEKEGGESSESITLNSSKEISLNYSGHSWSEDITFAPDDDTITFNNYVIGTPIKAVRTCEVCKETIDADSASITSAIPQDSCAERKVTVDLKAMFGEDAFTKTQEITIAATKHQLTSYTPYTKATCDQDGNYAHYTCGVCGNKYWSPEDTATPLTDDDIKIEKINHNFGLPKFDWENNGVTNTAKAVFTCMKCHGTVTISNLKTTKDTSSSGETIDCKAFTNVSYSVSVLFDKALVGKETGVDAFGYKKYSYPENSTEGTEYPGKVTRREVYGHDFTVKVEWYEAETASAQADDVADDTKPKYHTIDDGVVATLTCKNCKGEVVINSKTNQTTITPTANDSSNAAIEVAHGQIIATLDENPANGYKKARCTSDGWEHHDIKVLCRTDDGKGQQTYETTNAGTGTATPLSVEAPTEKIGHNWYVEDDPANVKWDDPNAANYPNTKGDVRVKLVCVNDPEHNTTLTGPTVGVNLSDTATTNPATCTENGKNSWTVTIDAPDSSEKITKYGKNQSGRAITIEKTLTALGHEFTPVSYTTSDSEEASAGFDWKSYDKGKGLYYVYKCTRQDGCDGKPDPVSDSQFADANTVTYEAESEGSDGTGSRTLKKVKATVTVETTEKPSCTKPGAGKTTAEIQFKDTTKTPLTAVRTGVLPAKGHQWSSDTVTWGNWEKGSGTTEITIGGKKYEIPVYSISGSRNCVRVDGSDWAACDKPAEKDTQTGTLGTAIDENLTSYVEITIKAHQDPTCTTGGSTEYVATFYEKGEDGTPVKVAENTQNTTTEPLGHKWNDKVDVVDWANKTERSQTLSNGTVIYLGGFDVNAYQSCQNEGCNGLNPVPVTVDVTGACNKAAEADAKGNVVFTAKVADASSGLTVAEKVATHAETYQNHSLERIAAGVAENCVTPTYKRHYHCPQCGFNYSNNDAVEPIEISFAPQGHKYGDPTFEWTAEGRSARAVFTCIRQNCAEADEGHTLSITATRGSLYTEEAAKCKTWAAQHPGEDATGIGFYAVNVEFDGNKYEDELPITLEPGDHKWITENDVKKCEYCGTLENNAVTVVYKTHVDKVTTVIREDLYQKSEVTENTAISIPTAPNQPSYVFDHWTIDGVSVEGDLATAVRAKIMDENVTTISVVAEYSKIEGKGKVTVQYEGITKPAVVAEDLEIGSRYTASVKNSTTVVENEKTWHFSHWKNEDGVTLGNNDTYEVYIQSTTPITIVAVYTEEMPAEPEPTVAMTDSYCSELAGGKVRLSFTATMSIPEGYTMVESGILYTKVEASATPDTMKIGAEGVSQKILNGVKTNTLSLNTSNRTQVWHARGYVRCQNTKTQEEKVYYASNILSGSYETLSASTATTK